MALYVLFPRHFEPLQRGLIPIINLVKFFFAYPASVVDTFTHVASALPASSVCRLRVVFHPMTVFVERTVSKSGAWPWHFPCLGFRCSRLWASAWATRSSLQSELPAVPDFYLVPMENDSGQGAA